jgi:anti-anti-sigma factor
VDVTLIEFQGSIEDFPSLIQTVDTRIQDGDRRIVLDLAALPFVNSAAIGYLVRAQKDMEAEGGELALARVQPAILRILEMTGIDELLPAFATVEEAVSYLGGDPALPGRLPRVTRHRLAPPGA